METVFFFGKVAEFCLKINNFATAKSIFDGIVASQTEVGLFVWLLFSLVVNFCLIYWPIYLLLTSFFLSFLLPSFLLNRFLSKYGNI